MFVTGSHAQPLPSWRERHSQQLLRSLEHRSVCSWCQQLLRWWLWFPVSRLWSMMVATISVLAGTQCLGSAWLLSSPLSCNLTFQPSCEHLIPILNPFLLQVAKRVSVISTLSDTGKRRERWEYSLREPRQGEGWAHLSCAFGMP